MSVAPEVVEAEQFQDTPVGTLLAYVERLSGQRQRREVIEIIQKITGNSVARNRSRLHYRKCAFVHLTLDEIDDRHSGGDLIDILLPREIEIYEKAEIADTDSPSAAIDDLLLRST